jgi:hydrogenase nickel incorporation protein HypA/HybF
MHEMAVCQSIADIVADHAERHEAQRVTLVRIEVGALSCVEPASLEFCFAAVTRDTVAASARLEISVTPGEAWCWDCEMAFSTVDRTAPCPTCGGVRLRVTGGDQLRVSELEAV